MNDKISYEQLELNNWMLELNLAQATMLNCQARMKELLPVIQQRQAELEAAKKDAECQAPEQPVSPSPVTG